MVARKKPDASFQLTQDQLRALPISDTGNAEAFEILYRHRFRYDHSRKRWLVWNGFHWMFDTDREDE